MFVELTRLSNPFRTMLDEPELGFAVSAFANFVICNGSKRESSFIGQSRNREVDIVLEEMRVSLSGCCIVSS
jgi:hypothetical protein